MDKCKKNAAAKVIIEDIDDKNKITVSIFGDIIRWLHYEVPDDDDIEIKLLSRNLSHKILLSKLKV